MVDLLDLLGFVDKVFLFLTADGEDTFSLNAGGSSSWLSAWCSAAKDFDLDDFVFDDG